MCFVIYSHSQHAKKMKADEMQRIEYVQQRNKKKNKKKNQKQNKKHNRNFFLHVHGRWNGQELGGNKWNGYVRIASVPYSIKSFSIILCITLSMKFASQYDKGYTKQTHTFDDEQKKKKQKMENEFVAIQMKHRSYYCNYGTET